jgi:hypothetical protein
VFSISHAYALSASRFLWLRQWLFWRVPIQSATKVVDEHRPYLRSNYFHRDGLHKHYTSQPVDSWSISIHYTRLVCSICEYVPMCLLHSHMCSVRFIGYMTVHRNSTTHPQLWLKRLRGVHVKFAHRVAPFFYRCLCHKFSRSASKVFVQSRDN